MLYRVVTNIGKVDFEGHFAWNKAMRSLDRDDNSICFYYFDPDGGEVAHYFPTLRSGTIFKKPRLWHEQMKSELVGVE